MLAKKDVHIGKEIQRVLHERNMNVSDFANRICCHRKNVYDIFKRKSLDIDRIIQISEILDYDFIKELYYEETPTIQTFKLLLRNGKLSVEEEK